LTVDVVPERAAAAAPGGWTPRDAWHDALRVLEVAAGIALIAFAVALPLVLLGAPAWIATRRLTQRRRERALDIA
jgi:ABC-type phosphate/phosphonate transport system permease subunit